MPLATGIEYLTSTRVVSADVAAKTLTTAGGDTISYEKLVVATGARVGRGGSCRSHKSQGSQAVRLLA